MYGDVFCQLREQLVDIALEETFLIDDDEGDDDAEAASKAHVQAKSMTLLRYMFKTVSLKTILTMGFKHRHLQFIIINFISSPVLPKVCSQSFQDLQILIHNPPFFKKILEAITANVNSSGEEWLYKTEDTTGVENDPVFMFTVDALFLIIFKSTHLLVRQNVNNLKMLAIVLRIHEHVAKYLATSSHKSNSKLWCRANLKQFRESCSKLSDEANVEFRRLNFEYIYFYLKIIQVIIKQRRPLIFRRLKSHSNLIKASLCEFEQKSSEAEGRYGPNESQEDSV
jgi:hypothetical protein